MKAIKEHPMQEHSSTLAVLFILAIIVAIAFLFASCQIEAINNEKPEKPFIIISKFYMNEHRVKEYRVKYSYLDKNHNIFYFQDTELAYHIGDTIK